MSFSFGFFNAKNMDRTYTAEDFTGYLSSIPYPPAMKKAIDVLQTKVGRAEERIEEVKDNGNSET